MTPFKPDSSRNHSVNDVPDHEGDQTEENVETLMNYITNSNRYGDLQVPADDDTLVEFNPAHVARGRMHQK